ncbi:hypothetical protein Tco_0415032 [Tanacetum coccineum]
MIVIRGVLEFCEEYAGDERRNWRLTERSRDIDMTKESTSGGRCEGEWMRASLILVVESLPIETAISGFGGVVVGLMSRVIWLVRVVFGMLCGGGLIDALSLMSLVECKLGCFNRSSVWTYGYDGVGYGGGSVVQGREEMRLRE